MREKIQAFRVLIVLLLTMLLAGSAFAQGAHCWYIVDSQLDLLNITIDFTPDYRLVERSAGDALSSLHCKKLVRKSIQSPPESCESACSQVGNLVACVDESLVIAPVGGYTKKVAFCSEIYATDCVAEPSCAPNVLADSIITLRSYVGGGRSCEDLCEPGERFIPDSCVKERLIFGVTKINALCEQIVPEQRKPCGIEDYIVPLFATMNVQNIGDTVINCVDGAAIPVVKPVRVMVKRAEENEYKEVSNNGYHTHEFESCAGGNLVIGGAKAIQNAYIFDKGGVYDVSIEYPRKSNGTDWISFRRFRVTVSEIALNISPMNDEEHMAFPVNPRGIPEAGGETKTKDVFWVIENKGSSKVSLSGMKAVGCEGQGLQCSFPDFKDDWGVEVGESYTLKQTVSASTPSLSPELRAVGISFAATDEYNFITKKDFSSKIMPVERSIEFSILGRAMVSHPIQGELQLDPGTYYAQVCVDSADVGGLQPVVALSITYDAAPAPAGSTEIVTKTAYFHSTPDCTAATFGGHGEATASFEIKKAQKISYLYSGDSGIEGAGYGNNWGRIGSAINLLTGYVMGLVLDKTMEPQQLLQNTTGPHTITLTMLDGVKTSGGYALPQISPPAGGEGEMGAVIYYLKDVKMPGGSVTAGPISRVTEGTESIFISSSGGEVSATTSAYETEPGAQPTVELVLMWLLGENFLLKINAGQEGVCFGPDDEIGITGKDVKPRIMFSWAWSSIGKDSCSYEKADSIYCDAAQFSIALLKRLEEIKTLAENERFADISALQHFRAYLMLDGYSPDFRADFDDYMRKVNIDTPPHYKEEWSKYFLNNSNLIFRADKSTGTTLPGPGIYQVDLEFDFETENPWRFFSRDAPSAGIVVKLKKLAEPVLNNPFYYLPFDGMIGLNAAATEFERNGYGVGFSGDEVRISLQDIGGSTYITTKKSNLGGVVSKLYITNERSFDYVHKTRKGRVMTITRRSPASNEFDLVYSPSYATPIVMQLVPTGKSAAAFYRLTENQKAIDGGTAMNNWSAFAETISHDKPEYECTDYESARLFYKRNDRQASTVSTCATSELPKTYGFSWDAGPEMIGTSIYAEGIFYTPLEKIIELQNACLVQGKFFSTAAPLGGVFSFGLKDNGERVDSIASTLASVGDEFVCMGITMSEDSAELWWNQEKIIGRLKDSLRAATTIPMEECYSYYAK